MTSVAKAAAIALLVTLGAAMTVSAASHAPGAKKPVAAPATRKTPSAPRYLSERIEQLGKGFNGRVGIAVTSLDERWSAGWNERELYPQQSASKLWVAI